MKKQRELMVNENDVTEMIKIIGRRLPGSMRYNVSYCEWASDDKQWCIEFKVSDRVFDMIHIDFLESVNIDPYYRRYLQQFRDRGLA